MDEVKMTDRRVSEGLPDRPEGQVDIPGAGVRRPYASPTVTVLGDIIELTLNGSGGNADVTSSQPA